MTQANLNIGDSIGITIFADGADSNDRTFYCDVVEVGARDGETAYRYQYPNGETSRALLPHSQVAKFRRVVEPDATRTAIAFSQAMNARFLLCGSDEELGGRWWNAFQKALTEIDENKTIEFNNGILTLRSRGTGQNYIVTKDGCSTNCKAEHAPDYHKAVYAILARRAELTGAANVLAFKPKSNGLTDSCGCVWNMNDKFIEKFCAACDSEQERIADEIGAWDGYQRQFAA